MAKHLEQETDLNVVKWEWVIKSLVDYILSDYKQNHARVRRLEQKELTPANYFKNQKIISELIAGPIPSRVARAALSLMVPA